MFQVKAHIPSQICIPSCRGCPLSSRLCLSGAVVTLTGRVRLHPPLGTAIYKQCISHLVQPPTKSLPRYGFVDCV